MSIIISIGMQKGGCGKTTTTCLSAYELSKSFRTLVIDMDHQGNSTYFLTRRSPYAFSGKTTLEGLQERDLSPYVVSISDTLHIVPAEDALMEFDGNPLVLRESLRQLQSQFDFILLDLPPHAGAHTQNGLVASDYGLVVLQSDPLCYEALERYLTLMQAMKDSYNPNLGMLGILVTLISSRASLDQAIIDQVKKDYEDWVFQTVIKRKLRIKEFSHTGISERYTQDRMALRQYKQFVKEMISRVSPEG